MPLNEDNEKIFTTVKILFEFISYFFEYEHFKLDILFSRTPGRSNDTVK